MPTKKQLTRIFIFGSAGILFVLALVAMFLGPKPANIPPSGPVVIETSEAPEPEIVAVDAATPSPAPAEALPETACTLLVDRAPVLTLESEDALRALLTDYLWASAVAPEDERFVSASFAAELIFVPAVKDAHLSAYDDALTLLINTPKTVPVRLTTERTERQRGSVETNETKDAALYKGSRLIKQLGFAGLTVTTARRSYVAGALESDGTPETVETKEARALLLRVGAWTGKGETPGKDEGVKGKDVGALVLSHPMRGSVSSYFGMRNGNMHSGLDITANAGTAITAPGEGVVVYCGERGAYGYVIDIDHGGGFVSRLTHIDSASVQAEYNQRVFAGDQLGSLAPADGGKKPHLHYELLIDSVPYNPLFYIG